MESKNKSKKGWLGILGCVIVAIIAFFIVLLLLNKAVKKVETVDVVAFSQNVTQKTEINKDNVNRYFSVIKVVKQTKPENTYASLDEVVADGKIYVDGNYVKNEVLTKEKVVSERKIEDAYTDKVEASFKVAAFDAAVGGTIRAGDRINITVVDSTGIEKYSIDNVYVAATFTSDGTLVKENDTTAIAVGFKIWLNGSELTDFNTNISAGIVKVSKM